MSCLRTSRLAALLLLVPLVAACGGAGEEDVEPTLTVFAAASLTSSFEQLATTFEADHPDVEVTFNFGPSSGLAEQLTAGAPADVFASASTSTMDAVAGSDLVVDRVDFASNSLQIAVPPANPAGIETLEDLADPEVAVAVCEPEVPCGVVAAEVLASAGLAVEPVTEEIDVKAVLTKVTLGEVDAGLVYVSDVVDAAEEVDGIEVPAEVNSETTYPIATLRVAADPDLAQEWVDLVTSQEGQRVLGEAGFGAP